MNVNTWGPSLWVFLHTTTFNASHKISREKQSEYLAFFESLGHILPCSYCRESYKVFTKTLPLSRFIKTRMGFAYWLYRIHHLVNMKLNKPHSTPPFVEVVQRFEQNKSDKNDRTPAELVHAAEKHYKKRADRYLRDLKILNKRSG